MNWNLDPIWIPLTEINGGEQYEGGDGVKAVDLTAIVQNLQVLYNTHTEGDYIDVGTVSVTTVDFTEPAAVSISTRRDPEDSRVLLDFTFSIPCGYPALTYGEVYYSNDAPVIGQNVIQEANKYNRTAVINDQLQFLYTQMNDLGDPWIVYECTAKVTYKDADHVHMQIVTLVRNSYGTVMRSRGVWTSGVTYYGDQYFRDHVVYAGSYYYCKSTGSSETPPPDNSDQWELVAGKGEDTLIYTPGLYYASNEQIDVGYVIIQEVDKFSRTAYVGDYCYIICRDLVRQPNDTFQTLCHVTAVDADYVTLEVLMYTSIVGPTGLPALVYNAVYYSDAALAVGNQIIQENTKFNRTAVIGDNIALTVAVTTTSPFTLYQVVGTVTYVDATYATITINSFEVIGDNFQLAEQANQLWPYLEANPPTQGDWLLFACGENLPDFGATGGVFVITRGYESEAVCIVSCRAHIGSGNLERIDYKIIAGDDISDQLLYFYNGETRSLYLYVRSSRPDLGNDSYCKVSILNYVGAAGGRANLKLITTEISVSDAEVGKTGYATYWKDDGTELLWSGNLEFDGNIVKYVPLSKDPGQRMLIFVGNAIGTYADDWPQWTGVVAPASPSAAAFAGAITVALDVPTTGRPTALSTIRISNWGKTLSLVGGDVSGYTVNLNLMYVYAL